MIVELLLVRGASAVARNSNGATARELLQSRMTSRAVTLDGMAGNHMTPTVVLLKESERAQATNQISRI